jgi:hypothetical protein
LLIPGVFELFLDYNYSPIMTSYGKYFTGPNAMLRYDFVNPNCILIPYLQGGAGFAFNDAFHNPDQRLIGEFFEFFLRAEFGMHLMLTENLSLNLEAGYQHISNADLASRNGGLNTLGAAVGLTYFFGR